MIKVGYQGIELSNSEMAAMDIVRLLGLGDVEFVPLVASPEVVDALAQGQVDYGVLAYENNLGGQVIETYEALASIDYEIVYRYKMPIHHALFVKDARVALGDVEQVVSHEQAIKQCKRYIATKLPGAEAVASKDTALSAQELKEGVLAPTAAVICRQVAGERHNLYLVEDNIEDSESITEFLCIKRK